MRLLQALRAGNRVLGRTTGFRVTRHRDDIPDSPPDLDHESREIIEAVRPYTMTSPEQIFNLISAVRYVHDFELPGAIVECGVWRGGSMMAAAWALLRRGDYTRDLHLFDTFDGMTAPEDRDFNIATGEAAAARLMRPSPVPALRETLTGTLRATLTEVKQALATVPYPPSRVHYIEGPVEQTLPSYAPRQISVLRLDTDWYSSTKWELDHLYPRLVNGGVLIIDDYGVWNGSKQATDEFLCASGARLLMLRMSGGVRIGVKP